MAVIATAGLPQPLNAKDQLPDRTRVVLRCLEESFAPAKSNPNKFQITREFEIVYPETITLNGQPRILAGIKLKQYRGVRMNNQDGSRNQVESDTLLAKYVNELKSLELPHDPIDDENPDLLVKGMFVDANIGSDEYERTAPLTPEEKAAGIKTGKPTGEKGYRPVLQFLLGKAQPVEGRPF